MFTVRIKLSGLYLERGEGGIMGDKSVETLFHI